VESNAFADVQGRLSGVHLERDRRSSEDRSTFGAHATDAVLRDDPLGAGRASSLVGGPFRGVVAEASGLLAPGPAAAKHAHPTAISRG
ncbi:hypothetical protein AAVH_30667, partial [Aphelenchoides avenae]